VRSSVAKPIIADRHGGGKPDRGYIPVFETFGYSFSKLNGSGEVLADECPFCAKENHFYLKATEGVFHCKRCDRGGNISDFLTEMHSRALKATTTEDWLRLKKKRGIASQTLKLHELAFDRGSGRWLIPFKNKKGEIINLQLYRESDGRKTNLTRLATGLYGLDRLSDDRNRILFLCEGPFDGIALDYHIGAVHRRKYDIVATPGPFKECWCEFFQGRKVRALFDNDKGGDAHRAQVTKLLGESRVASELRLLRWPADFPEHYDINDLVREHPEIRIPGWSLENSVRVVAEPKLIIRHGRASTEPKPIEWIWPDHLRCGTYVSFSGRQGTMKTTIALDIAARYSQGKRMPMCERDGLPAGHVLYIHAEDDAEAVDGGFETAGGDFDRWHTMPATIRSGDMLNVLEHLEEIEQVIREHDIRLVIIDGQNSVVGAPDIGTDMKGRANVTNKLHQFAQRLNVCLVGIRNEDSEGRALGSQSMGDISRCVLRAEELKQIEGQRYLRLTFVKVSDTAPKNYPPIPYAVEDLGGNLRRISWGKEAPKGLTVALKTANEKAKR